MPPIPPIPGPGPMLPPPPPPPICGNRERLLSMHGLVWHLGYVRRGKNNGPPGKCYDIMPLVIKRANVSYLLTCPNATFYHPNQLCFAKWPPGAVTHLLQGCPFKSLLCIRVAWYMKLVHIPNELVLPIKEDMNVYKMNLSLLQD